MSPTTFRLELPANWGAHPVWHSEHLRAADKLHQATHYAPVVDPPLRIEQILAHNETPSFVDAECNTSSP
ncbi:hypothetical protein RI054_34g133370 [Pseudoscourfieldia marina]